MAVTFEQASPSLSSARDRMAFSLPRFDFDSRLIGSTPGEPLERQLPPFRLLFLAGGHTAHHQSLMLIVRENVARLADGLDEIHSLFDAQLLDLAEFLLNPGVIRLIGAR
jgi:hypothetical protein